MPETEVIETEGFQKLIGASIKTVNKSLIMVDDEPFAPVICPGCFSNRFRAYEKMATNELSFICQKCGIVIISHKNRNKDTDVL